MISIKDKYAREIDYIRISVTDRCNLKCIYCMPKNNTKFINDDKILTSNEIFRIVKECANLGITKVRITGGEPLVRSDIVDLIKKINTLKGINEICMTTNGILLYENIDKLVKSGLTRVNISLDTLKPNRFNFITRGGILDKILFSINKCIENDIKVKINTVIMDGINVDEIVDFINLTKTKPIDIRFIELMPIGEGKKYKGISNEYILKVIKDNNLSYSIEKRKHKDGPAKYIKLVNGIGRIGFISSLSNCFCSECNRIRLTSDGFLKQCLNWNTGIDLREKLRQGMDDDALKNTMYDAIYNKPKKNLFGNEEHDNDKEKRLMSEIGG